MNSESLTIASFNQCIDSITNASKSQRVMKEVENKLQSYPFKFKESIILSGQAEGVFGWVTVNYLLENFVKVSAVSLMNFCFFC